MTNKSFQKLVIFLLLIGLIMTPIHPAKATVKDISPAYKAGLTAVITWYTGRCTIVGRISGVDELFKGAENLIRGVLASGVNFIRDIGASIFGQAENVLTSAMPGVGDIIGGAVPVTVEAFGSSAKKDIGQITANTALTAEKVEETDLCGYANRILNNVIRQQILDKATQDIINWIKGGYKGKVFVSDWDNFLENAGSAAVDQMVGTAIENSDLRFLCSPFGFQVRFTLLPIPDFASRERGCTLTTIQGNIDQFFQDFSNGGWLSYQEHWQPQNNFYGATLLAWGEANKQEATAREAAQNEALAGGGFLGQKDSTGRITTPGSVIGDAAGQVLAAPLGGIISAEELSDYVTAIINTVINQALTNSIDSLKKLND